MEKGIRFTVKKMDEINKEFNSTCENSKQHLRIINGLNGAMVVADNWTICTVDVLDEMIAELQIMREAITTETGIC